MSRFRNVLFGLLSLWLVSCPAFAADTNTVEELVYRASLGRADDIRLLIKQGISPDTLNDAGVPVLALAASRKDLEGMSVVEALIDNGADINAHDKNGQTALFYAAKQGNVPIVNYLLSKHANAYAVDVSGNQARMVAYLAGQNDVVVAMDEFTTKETKSIEKKQSEQSEKERLAKENAELKEQLKQKEAATFLDEDVKKLAYDLSYNSCAFQYWSFNSQQKQSTELNADEMDTAITTYQQLAEKNKDSLAQSEKLTVDAINRTITSAQTRIFNKLMEMGSNRQRREKGVGTLDDMKKRCTPIANEWDAQTPDLFVAKKAASTSAPAKAVTSQAPSPKPEEVAVSPMQDIEKLRKVSDDFVFTVKKKY